MSSGSLAQRVVELERELASLRVTVRDLEDRLGSVERGSDFELLESPASSAEAPSSTAAKGAGSGKGYSGTAEGADRDSILRRIGLWLRRALDGNRQGGSGRDLLGGPSRYYFVVRDFDGHTFNPARVISPWAAAGHLVKQGNSFGESIFVGLPGWSDIAIVARWCQVGVTFEPQDGRGRGGRRGA